MDKAKILQLCNQIEMIIDTVCNTGYTLQPGDEEAILSRTKAIMDEVIAPPKSNADHIRQMTEEELADILDNSQCAYCAYEEGCDDNAECSRGILEWLRKKVNEDAGTD